MKLLSNTTVMTSTEKKALHSFIHAQRLHKICMYTSAAWLNEEKTCVCCGRGRKDETNLKSEIDACGTPVEMSARRQWCTLYLAVRRVSTGSINFQN